MSSKLMGFACAISKSLLGFIDWITPLATLVVRCFISYQFLLSGWLRITGDWNAVLVQFAYFYRVPLLPPAFAAVLGTGAELVIPILVILGLGGRLVVAMLFLLNLVAATLPYLWTPDGWAGLYQLITWGMILLMLMCYGTGKWSLDNLLFKKVCQPKRSVDY